MQINGLDALADVGERRLVGVLVRTRSDHKPLRKPKENPPIELN